MMMSFVEWMKINEESREFVLCGNVCVCVCVFFVSFLFFLKLYIYIKLEKKKKKKDFKAEQSDFMDEREFIGGIIRDPGERDG